jgi:hypothetical protein
MPYTPLDFKIRRGLSTDLFESDNITVKADVKLELGCWYLCTDTACVYVCVKKDLAEADITENRTLKRINSTAFDLVEKRVESLIQQSPYVEIKSESDLPKNFDDPNFNPNIAYYIITDPKLHYMSLYIFDRANQCYICTNKADLSILEDQIVTVVDTKLEEVLDDKLIEKVPQTVKTTVETHVLFGGNSTTSIEDDYIA